MILQPFSCENTLFVFEKLVEIAGEHTVIKLSYLISLSTVKSLELWVGGDDIYLPWGEALEVYANLTVEGLYLTQSAESLAVRGI